MQNQPFIPTHRIVAFLIFICGALFSSLFIYHLSNSNQIKSTLSADDGTLFPSAREIQPFTLYSGDQKQPFTLKSLSGHITLLFFGFTHCSSICPTILDLMSRAYNQLSPQYPNLQVVFISLDPLRDTPASLQKYTQSFNPRFISATGEMQEIRKLQSQLGIFATRVEAKESNYQLQHTASILLFDTKGRWAGILKSERTPTQFAAAFSNSMKLL